MAELKTVAVNQVRHEISEIFHLDELCLDTQLPYPQATTEVPDSHDRKLERDSLRRFSGIPSVPRMER